MANERVDLGPPLTRAKKQPPKGSDVTCTSSWRCWCRRSKVRLCWTSGAWRGSRNLVEQWTPPCDSSRFVPAAWQTRRPHTYSRLPITRFGGCWISCPRRVLLHLSLLSSQFQHLTNLQRRPLGRRTRQSAAGEINVATGLRWTTGSGLAASRVKSQGTLFPSQSVIGEINVATEPQGTIGNGCRFRCQKLRALAPRQSVIGKINQASTRGIEGVTDTEARLAEQCQNPAKKNRPVAQSKCNR